MWKFAAIVLVVVFVVADSIYIYRRIKKHWQNASWQRTGQKSNAWKLGLSSLELPLNKQADKDPQPPKNT